MYHVEYTHGIKSLTIPAIAYFINSLDGQSCGRERGDPIWYTCKLGMFLTTITGTIFKNCQAKEFLGERHKL